MNKIVVASLVFIGLIVANISALNTSNTTSPNLAAAPAVANALKNDAKEAAENVKNAQKAFKALKAAGSGLAACEAFTKAKHYCERAMECKHKAEKHHKVYKDRENDNSSEDGDVEDDLKKVKEHAKRAEHLYKEMEKHMHKKHLSVKRCEKKYNCETKFLYEIEDSHMSHGCKKASKSDDSSSDDSSNDDSSSDDSKS